MVKKMDTVSKILVTAPDSMIGKGLIVKLKSKGFLNIQSTDIDLTDQKKTLLFFEKEKPDYVFFPGGIRGGIKFNSEHPAELIYNNLQIQTNVLHCSFKTGVRKLLFIGSSCMYPENALQPMKEEYLMQGPMEPIGEFHSIAKMSGLKMCQAYKKQYGCNFITAIPATIYGPSDNFNSSGSHVLSALIAKFCSAQKNNEPSVTIWGSGRAERDFIHIDDFSEAACFLMDHYDDISPINITCTEGTTIKDLAYLIKDIIPFNGQILFDSSKPDGTLRKILDGSKLSRLGWQPEISLREGVRSTSLWYYDEK